MEVIHDRQTSPKWPQLGADLFAATASALLVSPTVTIIDRSLVEKASGKPLLSSLRTHTATTIKHPAVFLSSPAHAHVFALYAATYTVANTSETLCKDTFPAADAITFACTFAVNVPLGVWKDIRFAQFFGQTLPLKGRKGLPTPIPKAHSGTRAAAATLLLRDAATIYGSFTLAQKCADYIPDSLAVSPSSKTVLTQLVVPVLSQIVATPLHLLGLDMYNRPYKVAGRDRLKVVLRDLPSATVIRGVRIIPAFRVGCLVNLGLRG
ncbi:hypothetical protein BDV18DRAFT_159448 [Aspergillus unguis]